MITIHFAEGFEEIEALTVVDILRRADLDVCLVSITGKLNVKGAHGISINVDKLIEDVDYNNVDMIVLPGGMPGTKYLGENKKLTTQIKYFAEHKKVAAICAAPSILGKLGLLKDKKATCYPGFEKSLTKAIISQDKVIKDDNIITGKGPGAASEFAFEILKYYKDEKTIEDLKNNMIY